MSGEDKRVIDIRIPQEYQAEYVSDLADFIERELKPPSRVWWLMIYFLLGLAGGLGLGGFIAWWLR
jgi:hypothetical protein